MKQISRLYNSCFFNVIVKSFHYRYTIPMRRIQMVHTTVNKAELNLKIVSKLQDSMKNICQTKRAWLFRR